MAEDTIAKRNPIYRQLKDLGGEFIAARGWDIPHYFSGNEENADSFDLPAHVDEPAAVGVEHLQTRENVAMTTLPINAALEITGNSAASFIQRMFSNDMAMDVGQSRYAPLLNEDGGVLADLVVSRVDPDQYFAFSLAGSAGDENTKWLKRHAPADVAIHNSDDGWACMGVYGPNALDTVEPLADADLSREGLPFYHCKKVTIGEIPTIAVRLSYVGEFGWEFWTPAGYEIQLWDTLWDAVREQDGSLFGVGALVSMGIEKGYHVMDADLGPEYTPFEAGLDHFVAMETDFIGKDALTPDVSQRRVGIAMEENDVLPEAGDTIAVDGEAVAEVSRSGYGYSVDKNIVYAYLPVEYCNADEQVTIQRENNEHPGVITEGALFDPADERMR